MEQFDLGLFLVNSATVLENHIHLFSIQVDWLRNRKKKKGKTSYG
jgi:hypothetical protein